MSEDCVKDMIDDQEAAEHKLDVDDRPSIWSFSGGFRHIFYHSNIGMGLVDLSGKWLAINSPLSTLLGESEHKLVSSRIQEHFQPDTWPIIQSRLFDLYNGKTDSAKLELVWMLMNGKQVRISMHLSVMKNTASEPEIYLFQFIPDSKEYSACIQEEADLRTPSVQPIEKVKIAFPSQETNSSEHKRVAFLRGGRPHRNSSRMRLIHPRELRSQELSDIPERDIALYHKLVEKAQVGVYLYQNGQLIYINSHFAKMFGYPRKELLGRDLKEFMYPADHLKLDKVTEWEENMHFQCRGTRYGGSILELEGHGACIMFRGKPAWIGTVVDITERKKNEERLRKSERLSVAGQLAAGVAHEIRNPLTSLKGFLHLMRTKNSDNQMYLDIMQSEIEKINFIVNEFLLLAKPHSVQFKRRKIYDLIWKAVDRLKPQAIHNKVRMMTEIEPNLPPIHCEAEQLIQAFVNIMMNGIEAMPNGGTLEVSVCLSSPDRISIQFKDDGPGIPEERLDKLGEPYYLPSEKGSGFGLMLSYKIIEAHNGTVNVYSEIDEGTVVEVSLPVQARAVAE